MPFPIAIIGALLPTILKTVAPSLTEIFTQLQNKEISVEVAVQETQRVFYEAWAQVETAAIQASRDIIIAEAQSESWLTRNWRPITMMTFLWVILWYAWLQPALVAWAGLTPIEPTYVQIGELINLITIGLTGYVGGRSLEKIANNWRSGKAALDGAVTAALEPDGTGSKDSLVERIKQWRGPKGQ